jgi:hypothetical protein
VVVEKEGKTYDIKYNMAELDVPRFYERLGRIHAHFMKHR